MRLSKDIAIGSLQRKTSVLFSYVKGGLRIVPELGLRHQEQRQLGQPTAIAAKKTTTEVMSVFAVNRLSNNNYCQYRVVLIFIDK